MTAQELFNTYYPTGSSAREYLYIHSMKVVNAAIKVVEHNPHLNANLEMVKEMAFLHDIGIIFTYAPEIGCTGNLPYIAHGYMGRKLLEENGFEKIAPVCERHIGVGLSIYDILENRMPLPHRDMLPITIEEKIVCYADKFYSKTPKHLIVPKQLDKIRKKISRYGKDKIERFDEMVEMFGDINGY